MRPVKKTEAHHTDGFAELVCSNSFRSDDINSAIGLLHEEMRKSDSIIMKAAENHKLPAGGALAVDRDGFSKNVQEELEKLSNIKILREEVTELPKDKLTIVATGPLTSQELTKDILKVTGENNLAFFDAIAPIVYKESIDFSKAWYQSRYDKKGPAGDGADYINCPFLRINTTIL